MPKLKTNAEFWAVFSLEIIWKLLSSFEVVCIHQNIVFPTLHVTSWLIVAQPVGTKFLQKYLNIRFWYQGCDCEITMNIDIIKHIVIRQTTDNSITAVLSQERDLNYGNHRQDFINCVSPSLYQIPSVWLTQEEHFAVVPPNLVVRGPSGSSVRASPSEGIEVPPLQPAPLPGLLAGWEGRRDWLHGFQLVGFSSPDVARWSAASG
jgi:hypothetical protein